MTPEEITQEVLDGMAEIGGIPSNESFYAEFNDRLRAALGIPIVVGRSEQLKAFAEYLDDLHGGEPFAVNEIGSYLKSL